MSSRFRIDVKPDGAFRLFIDDQDVSSLVASFNLHGGSGEPPELVLELVSGAALATGSGEALELTDGLPATALVEALDPTIIERGVNEWMEANGGTVGEAMIGVLSTITEAANKELDDEE